MATNVSHCAFSLYFLLSPSQPYFNIHYRGEQQLFNVSLTPLIIVVADDDILCCFFLFFSHFLSHLKNEIKYTKWSGRKNRDGSPSRAPSRKFHTQFHSDHDDVFRQIHDNTCDQLNWMTIHFFPFSALSHSELTIFHLIWLLINLCSTFYYCFLSLWLLKFP